MPDQDLPATGAGAAVPVPAESDRALAMRASDAERHVAAEVVRDAAADGRLGLDELDERLERVYAARTRGDLVPVLADLEAVAAKPPARPDAAEPMVLEVRSGTISRRGHWEVPPHIVARCTSGNVKLDLTTAVCPHREVLIEASAASGNVVVVVPRGWTVRLDSSEVGSGTVKNKATDPPDPGTPLIRLIATVRSGNVKARYPFRSKRREA